MSSLVGFGQKAVGYQAGFQLHFITDFFRLQCINKTIVIGESTPAGAGMKRPEHGGVFVRVINLGGIRQPLWINFPTVDGGA